MSGLTIGTLTINPTFDAEVMSYTASTSNAQNKIKAVADEGVEIAITLNGATVENGSNLTWTAGENTVKVVASLDEKSTEYTVIVTKS